MSQKFAVLNRYLELWISGHKEKAALLRTEEIRKLYFEDSPDIDILQDFIKEESADIAFRAETYSYADWIAFHKRDNNEDKEFTRINSLLQLKFNKDVPLKEIAENYSNECGIFYKTQRTLLFEQFVFLHYAKCDEEVRKEILRKLTMYVGIISQELVGFIEAVFENQDLSPYEAFIDKMSDDAVFDSGLDPDADIEHKNSLMTLALAYIYVGKKEDAKRVLEKLGKLIDRTVTYYWLFRFVQKEIDDM